MLSDYLEELQNDSVVHAPKPHSSLQMAKAHVDNEEDPALKPALATFSARKEERKSRAQETIDAIEA